MSLRKPKLFNLAFSAGDKSELTGTVPATGISLSISSLTESLSRLTINLPGDNNLFSPGFNFFLSDGLETDVIKAVSSLYVI